MKGQLLCLSIVTALFAAAANAQVPFATTNVPFEFFVGKSKLPAGEYQVDSPAPKVLRFSSPDRRTTILVMTHAASRSSPLIADGQLVFNKYGDQHFLAKLWAPGATYGYELRPSALERELIARSQQLSQHVIAARKR
jgi:hypothetical protein